MYVTLFFIRSITEPYENDTCFNSSLQIFHAKVPAQIMNVCVCKVQCALHMCTSVYKYEYEGGGSSRSLLAKLILEIEKKD